jgi:site-specific recombinase XerD
MPYVSEFLKYKKIYDDSSKNTIDNYLIDLKLFFEFTDGRYSHATARTFQNFVENRLDKGDSRNTIRRRLSALKSYYRYLYNQELIEHKISDRIKYISKDPERDKKIIEKKTIIKILDSINDVKHRAVVETLYSTGVREGELSALDIKDVDFINGMIVVSRSSANSNRTKSGKTRVIPIGKEALKWIKAYIGKRKDGPLFLNNKYKRLGEKGIYNIVKQYFNVSPHELRHAFATHLIAETGNIKAVSEMLGHANTNITEMIYTHLNAGHLKEVHERGMGR